MDRVALVTGASRGIGAAIAASLADQGFSLALVARGEEALETQISTLVARAPGITCEAIAIDLADADAPTRIIERVRRRFGRLDLLVNNAGAVASGPFGSYSPADWERIMAINARAPFFLMQEALPLLEASADGRIITIGSVVSRKGYADQALYTASKHALHGMTKVAARELASRGIRVHTILPGGVDTEMVRDVRPDIDPSELVQPEEVARVVTFLLSMEGNGVIDEVPLRRGSKPAFD